MIEVGQIWRFDRHAPFSGLVRIYNIDGWGEITGEYFDSIGTPVRWKIEQSWLGERQEDDTEFDYPEDW